jgi:hypothetical protein
MKRLVLFLIAAGISSWLVAQNIAITDEAGYIANPSAMLDVFSISKGLLVPRLTFSQREAISSPAKGLLIYQLDEEEGFYYNEGTPNAPQWAPLGKSSKLIWERDTANHVTYLANADDSVGIGLSDPGHKLEVSGGVKVGGKLYLVDVPDDQTHDSVLTIDNGVVKKYALSISGSDSCLWTKTGNRVYLTVSTDSVGIGTSTPGEQLELTGNIRLPDSDSTKGIIYKNDICFLHNTGRDNTFLGAGAGNVKLDTLSKNRSTGIGAGCLKSLTSGMQNVAVGAGAMANNKNCGNNVAIGYQALYSQVDYVNLLALPYTCNTAVGCKALYSNAPTNMQLEGTGNTAVGFSSLLSNTTGYLNTSMGHYSLSLNATGKTNTSMGSYSLSSNISGSGNVAIGYNSLYKNTTDEITAVGYNAGYSNTTGTENSFFGSYSGYSNSSGRYNSFYGYTAGQNVVQGWHNSFFGRACGAGGDGDENSFYGGMSGFNNNASYNSFFGYQSGQFNTSGTYNAFFGHWAGQHNTTGGSNTYIGAGADGTIPGVLNNATAIGYHALATADDQVRIGNQYVTSIGGYAEWSNISDERFKKDVQSNVKGLDFIMKLNPVTYNLDVRKLLQFLNIEEVNEKAIAGKESILQSGFLAREVEQAARESGYDFSGVDRPQNENDFYGLRYAEFVVPLVKAVQEQQVIIEELKKEIEALKAAR